MKTIKIKLVGFWKDVRGTQDRQHLFQILKKNYNVELSDNPDYVICSVFGKEYDYCKYDAIRIMYVGENYIPDFNLIDYGISNYPLNFQDRAFYFPFCIDEFGHCQSLEFKDRNYPDSILNDKKYFANFIAGHESENGIRGNFFKKLCEYKRVESCGTYLNNMSNGETVQWDNDSKREFQNKCKFTLCFESTKHEGFVTEKIVDAFYADTIPIYYGSDNVKDIFNEKAFINCADYPDYESVLKKIKELDEDDEKYLAMLREPIFKNPTFPSDKLKELEEYVKYIFDQPLEKAGRRSKVYSAKVFNDYNKLSINPKRASMKYAFKIFGNNLARFFLFPTKCIKKIFRKKRR